MSQLAASSHPAGTLALCERLKERRTEIERATLTRVYGVSDPASVGDPQYVAGLRAAVSAAVAYGIEGIAGQADRPEPVPTELLAQARQAARSGVSLDTVLRRYFAGYALISDFVVQEAEGAEISACDLQRSLRAESALFDRLVAAVSDEHTREAQGRSRTSEERRAEQVRMLLAGELLEAPELGYDLGAWHIGVIAAGPGAKLAIRELASALDRRSLSVRADAGALWAWLGGRRKVAAREVLHLAESRWPPDIALALGEPGEGIEGWRLSHRQAKAAVPIALRGAFNLVRYADAALLAAALGDEVLAESLQRIYLLPLAKERDGGVALRETLAAYFAAGRNVSATAGALQVSRKTVSFRLRAAEQRIGQPIDSCPAELETALRLCHLGSPPSEAIAGPHLAKSAAHSDHGGSPPSVGRLAHGPSSIHCG